MENITNFYLNKEILRQNYIEYSKIGQIYYPLKTNSNATVIKELNELYQNSDNGFLVTHISHYYKLINLGISPKNMCIVNIITEDKDIKFFYKNGIRYFTFDNIQQLENFLEYANSEEIKIAIRLNIIEVFDVFSHLGATTKECKNMLELLSSKKVQNVGLSFYLQKELLPQTDILNKMLDYIESNFKNYKMSFLNIGGAIKPKDIDVNRLNEIKTSLDINNIIVEPGRYLIGNAGYMETNIIKKKSDSVFIIKNGIYSGLLDALLYNKKFELYLKVNDKLIPLQYEEFDNSKEFILCGASSDSGDIIGKLYIESNYYKYLVPNAIIIVSNALAYVEEFFMPLGGDIIKKYTVI